MPIPKKGAEVGVAGEAEEATKEAEEAEGAGEAEEATTMTPGKEAGARRRKLMIPNDMGTLPQRGTPHSLHRHF